MFGNASGGGSIDYEALARAMAHEMRARPLVAVMAPGVAERSLMSGVR
jgi:hypothetical protein